MAETVLGFLYNFALSIVRGIAGILVSIFGEFVQNKTESAIVEYFNPTKKLEQTIGILRANKWFLDLESDYRYGHVIWHNEKVKTYLMEDKNVSALQKHPEEQLKFTQLVMHEHRKFIDR